MSRRLNPVPRGYTRIWLVTFRKDAESEWLEGAFFRSSGSAEGLATCWNELGYESKVIPLDVPAGLIPTGKRKR